ncbi:MAG: helix-turn-helix transcriptional regulator [Chitinophaga sp.]|uniref:helix-turn-helix domain-containing protein n=1 Tax=Chitinophaga sp. TaxID=1869181 RepID=UPI001B2E8F4F|nr:AraC family transcriptional regulator [Chitinophaga sp.]MBO9729703.1 helix-turn-helix transcriptional regulator [Chitinophaga sp.]
MLSSYKIFIKGMVCDRCILTVKDALQELQIPVTGVTLGEFTTVSALSGPDLEAVREKLQPLGFTLLEDKKTKLVRDIKSLVEKVYSGSYDFPENFRFSQLSARTLHKDYDFISNTFSELEGSTLEKYIIAFRTEKVKEFLVYTDETLSDIAFRLGYSSGAHLSRQFKDQTGLNTSYFKEIRKSKEALSHQSEEHTH